MKPRYKVGDILVYIACDVEEKMIVDRIEDEGDEILYWDKHGFLTEDEVIRVELPVDLKSKLKNIMTQVHNLGIDSREGQHPDSEVLMEIAHELAVLLDNM